MTAFLKDKNQIQRLNDSADNSLETKRLISKFQNHQKERNNFYLTIDELEEILKWKLRGQYGRQKKMRQNNTNENVELITKTAFSITHSNKNYETELKLRLLTTIDGVGIPVASAILTLCYPNQFCVIDFRNWRLIKNEQKKKENFTTKNYLEYFEIIRDLANKYNVTPQQIDIAIWQHDIETNKKSV